MPRGTRPASPVVHATGRHLVSPHHRNGHDHRGITPRFSDKPHPEQQPSQPAQPPKSPARDRLSCRTGADFSLFGEPMCHELPCPVLCYNGLLNYSLSCRTPPRAAFTTALPPLAGLPPFLVSYAPSHRRGHPSWSSPQEIVVRTRKNLVNLEAKTSSSFGPQSATTDLAKAIVACVHPSTRVAPAIPLATSSPHLQWASLVACGPSEQGRVAVLAGLRAPLWPGLNRSVSSQEPCRWAGLSPVHRFQL
jgi:hypothetical protein